jgi:hypothetical protein
MEVIKKANKHIKKHKTEYYCIITGVVVAGITVLIMRSNASQRISRGIPVTASRGIPVTGESVVSNITSHNFFGKSKILSNVSYISSNRQGPPSWVIRCLETGGIFSSQRGASLEMDLPESEISRHLNGMIDHVRGYHFERICLAA